MSEAKPKDAVKSWREWRLRRKILFDMGLTREKYDKYLETPHWKEFRRQAFAEQRKTLGENRCNRCQKSKVTLHVHHLTYERLGKELLTDVEIICGECHEKEHGRDEQSRARHYAPGYRDA
jgi:5-methylcytosine-specific restriction endonuclease McrA